MSNAIEQAEGLRPDEELVQFVTSKEDVDTWRKAAACLRMPLDVFLRLAPEVMIGEAQCNGDGSERSFLHMSISHGYGARIEDVPFFGRSLNRNRPDRLPDQVTRNMKIEALLDDIPHSVIPSKGSYTSRGEE